MPAGIVMASDCPQKCDPTMTALGPEVAAPGIITQSKPMEDEGPE